MSEHGEGTGDAVRRRWQLVLPHRERLVAVARRITGDADAAEDCAQEAMLRAVTFEHLDESEVLGFLVTTTARLSTDFHRRRSRDQRLARRVGGLREDPPGPDDVVCDRAEAAWVAAQLHDLPERQRAAVEARAAGFSPAEIAAAHGTSYKSIELLLYRVRARARVALTATFALLLGQVRRLRGPAGTATAATAVAFTATLLVFSPPGGHRPTPPADAGPASEAPAYVAEAQVRAAAPVPTPAPRPRPTRAIRPAARTSPLPDPPMEPCPVQYGNPEDVCVSPDPSDPPGMSLVDCVVAWVARPSLYCSTTPSPFRPGG